MGKDRLIELLAKKHTGSITLRERRELNDLLATDKKLRLLARQVDLLFAMRLESNDSATGQAKKREDWERLLKKMDSRDHDDQPAASVQMRRRSYVWWIAASVMVLCLAVAGYLLLPTKISHGPESSVVSTRKGSKSSMVLPDGTQVWMNSSSRVAYRDGFGKSHRELELVGEAYFDVVKDPENPFIIHTGDISIKVLGTAFNVRSYPEEDDIVTTLVRGSLEVQLSAAYHQKVYNLKPDEKLIVKRVVGETKELPPADSTKEVIKERVLDQTDTIPPEAQWTKNRLVFIEKPLAEIAAILSRWYDMKVIVVGDSEFKQLKFTGYYEDQSIQNVLESLSRAGDITYTIDVNTIYIKSKKR